MPMEADFSAQQALIAELTQRKQELQYELSSYENTQTVDRTRVGFMLVHCRLQIWLLVHCRLAALRACFFIFLFTSTTVIDSGSINIILFPD